MNFFHQYSTILSVAGGITALGVIFAGVMAVYKVARRVDGALGVDEQGRSVSDRLNRVEHQLWENGGDSLADRVNDMAMCARETSAEVKIIKEIVLTMLGQSTPTVAVMTTTKPSAKAPRKKKSV